MIVFFVEMEVQGASRDLLECAESKLRQGCQLWDLRLSCKHNSRVESHNDESITVKTCL